MKSMFVGLAGAAALVVAAAAGAQTTGGAVGTGSAAPSVNLWYVGVGGGVGVVNSASGAVSVEAGWRVVKNLDILLEGGWVGDLTTRREVEKVQTVANFLGPSTTGTMKVPTLVGAVGVRYVIELHGMFRPYVMGSVGGASVDLKPKFVQAGTDITGNLSQMGVTLGQDLQGKYRPLTVGAGFGVVMPFGDWYADIGLRFNSVNTTGQRSNLSRFLVGVGRRF